MLIPHTFTRRRHQLRALLIEQQCWFCATDLGRLIGQPHLDERATRTLDADQLIDAVVLNTHGQPETTRLISESGVYAALIHYYPENRCIHSWISADVVPILREAEQPAGHRPRRENRQGLSLLHWQGDTWMPYRPA
ncbi:MAG TPA: phage antirepressor [Pseudomonas oleovorans]|nr:phage antirepressor [Pseudomonas oleovorans]